MAQRGNIDYEQIKSFQRQGNGNLIQMAGSGAKTNGHVLIYDANGNAVDGGSSPSSNVLTTKGDILTYDGGLVRLGVGTDGQVLTARSSATHGVDWEAGGGGGGGNPGSGGGGGTAFQSYTVPVTTNFTALAGNTATVADTSTGITITGSAGQAAVYTRSAGLSTTWNIEIGLMFVIGPENFGTVGLSLRAGASGAYIAVVVQHNGSPLQLLIQTLTSAHNFNSNVKQWSLTEITHGGSAVYFRVKDDGTNRTYYISADLLIWSLLYSEARTTWATVDRGGFSVSSSTNFGPCARVVHYKEY